MPNKFSKFATCPLSCRSASAESGGGRSCGVTQLMLNGLCFARSIIACQAFCIFACCDKAAVAVEFGCAVAVPTGCNAAVSELPSFLIRSVTIPPSTTKTVPKKVSQAGKLFGLSCLGDLDGNIKRILLLPSYFRVSLFEHGARTIVVSEATKSPKSPRYRVNKG